jgi:SpoVK/Ycf46/Vps4 family AAA+-type ATPase
MARCLGWPLLSISPAHLLVDGIDGLEARAEAIFDDLLRLKRVVVLFDECEEFFRRRLTVGSPENRTQGAFITAGMLPRLQDLRQRNWTVFVIATNTELEELDPAVIRRGRLDKKQRLGHPTLAAQADYLVEVLERGRDESAHLGRSERSAVRSALVRYDEEHLRERRTVFNDDRKKALELRKQDGDMREYFERVNRTAIKEAELPVVTFSVLDAVAAALDGSRVVDVEEVYVALCWVADAEETDGWAVVP